MHLCKGGVKHAALDGFVRYPLLPIDEIVHRSGLPNQHLKMRSQHAVLIWGIGGFAPTSKIRLGSTQTLLAKTVTQFAIPEKQMSFLFSVTYAFFDFPSHVPDTELLFPACYWDFSYERTSSKYQSEQQIPPETALRFFLFCKAYRVKAYIFSVHFFLLF